LFKFDSFAGVPWADIPFFGISFRGCANSVLQWSYKTVCRYKHNKTLTGQLCPSVNKRLTLLTTQNLNSAYLKGKWHWQANISWFTTNLHCVFNFIYSM